mmetsp:Transcript_19904/g.44947  ORF Transcript_19904/g.44947 Transcript_19904/m.44947 type:complete len:103 (-) Transcript_19904:225-533(-)
MKSPRHRKRDQFILYSTAFQGSLSHSQVDASSKYSTTFTNQGNFEVKPAWSRLNQLPSRFKINPPHPPTATSRGPSDRGRYSSTNCNQIIDKSFFRRKPSTL